MFRLIGLFVVSLIFVSFADAQSGRRVNPAPTPVATPASENDPTQYSESKPRANRTARPTDRFPGVSIQNSNKTAPAPAATPATVAATSADDGETIRIDTNLITIPVSVFDRNGLYISGLRQSDFKIFEDGSEQEIAYFGTTDKPITVALVIDVSPSTMYRIEEIQRAAIAFINLLEPQDTVIVIEFDHNVRVLAEATKDREKIIKAIRKADFGDGTSLYNAVDESLRKQLARIEGRKAMVIFTDGVDTTSRKNSYDSTINYAEETDSLVFPIYYNTYSDMRGMSRGGIGGGGGGILGTILGGGNVGGISMPSAEAYAVGRRYLEELSEVTGGRVFRPEATPGGLTRAFEGIAEELRRQYNIGFVPDSEGKPGQRKTIKVRVNRPNLLIRARDSYIVGSNTTAPVLTETKK